MWIDFVRGWVNREVRRPEAFAAEPRPALAPDRSLLVRTLYLCYFGLRQPLVQTQVLPYLRQLSAGGVDVTLLTFEPELRQSWPQEERQQARQQLQAAGIRWLAAPYHKRPSAPATLYDIITG